MNERIFKLALKAMDFQGAVDIDTELKITNSELAKFAVLIVRECATMCINEGRAHDQWFGSHCAITVKEHFGVEE
jgi:hypothetical protein